MHPQVSLFYVEMRECFVFALQILYHQLFHHHGVAVQPQWCTHDDCHRSADTTTH